MTRTTLFICSVYPDLTRVWYHYASRYTDLTHVRILVYDCGGHLDSARMARARVERRPNIEHGLNIDRAVAECRTPVMFLSDDDTFLVSPRAETEAAVALTTDGRLAAVSYCPREWWHLMIDRVPHPVIGTSALVFRTDLVRAEGLSFRRVPTEDPSIRNGEEGCYDTGDYLAEQLLRRGYLVSVPPAAVRRSRVLGYSGVSRGFLRYARFAGLRAGWIPTLRGAALEADLVAQASDRSWPLQRLRWACGIAATIGLHRKALGTDPVFTDFPDWDTLAGIASRFPDACRTEAGRLVAASRDIQAELVQAA